MNLPSHHRSTIMLISLILTACGKPTQPSLPSSLSAEATPTAVTPRVGIVTLTPIATISLPTPSLDLVAAATNRITPITGISIPVPTIPADDLKSTPTGPLIDIPTPGPEEVYHKEVTLARPSTLTQTIQQAPVIVRGIVIDVGAPQWSTPDGQRPPNPFAHDTKATIFRPVRLQIQTPLKGTIPDPELLMYGLGGNVGQDTVRWTGDDRYTFAVGDEVIVFVGQFSYPPTINGTALWDLYGKATIVNGKATSTFFNLPLQELLATIAQLGGQ